MYQNINRFCFLDGGEEVTAGVFVGYGKLLFLFGWHYFARDQTQVSRIAGGFFTSWATREAHLPYNLPYNWANCN